MNPDNLIVVGQLLIKHKLHIAFAESATAGRLAAEFSLMEDAGKFLKGAFVCYDACLKESVLGVPRELIDKYTPESMEVTKAITAGLQKIIDSDIYIGITGLPAPGGSETEEKPVGTMFIYGFHHKQEILCEKVIFQGSPEQIILQTVREVGQLLKEYLTNSDLNA